MTKPRSNLADTVFRQLKNDIFDFVAASRANASAKTRSRRGWACRARRCAKRSTSCSAKAISTSRRDPGWNVRPFDFAVFEDLYDLRTVLELAAAERMCSCGARCPEIAELKRVWIVPAAKRLTRPWKVAQLDERFHETIVRAAQNREMSHVHHDITERIRIVRRLDFTEPERIRHTYDEHAAIVRALAARSYREAKLLLTAHIAQSKAEVRRITLHKLHAAGAARQ